MSMSAIKTAARTALHAAMAEPAVYNDGDALYPSAEQLAEGLILTVRFSTKSKLLSPESDGLSIMENVEKLIFQSTQLDALGIELEQGAVISIPGYGIDLVLDQPLDGDGPLNIYWTVTRAV